jgi:CDGSH-type Zn-finger protein
MNKGEITQKRPYALELEPGDYWWCACGRSQTQPFCDGSHKGTGHGPQKFTLTERGRVWLCGCRRSGTAPHCDGTHNFLEPDAPK